LIAPLTDQVVTLAAEQASAWRRSLPIAVNLATSVLADPGSAARYAARFAEHGIAPASVTFEISEAGLLDGRARSGLAAYSEHGFRLALDDFGTGYAAYAHLKNLAVDVVKIDRSFVQDLPTDPRDEAIVGSIAFVAERLGLDTIAEGVEAASALPRLHRLGVRAAQGFHLSHPLPSPAFERCRDGWQDWAHRAI
jgi:EAL domain-containing protein (putative c-di-GMP-specific phosphodiesterase class I)